MGKKEKSGTSLGRSLIKDRFGHNKGKKLVSDNSMLHTTEIQDGYDWGRLNLQSVTEESSFQEFLSTAELAGTEFQAEKLNIKFVNPKVNAGLLSRDEMKQAKDAHIKYKEMLKIPRRPPWTSEMTSSELDQNEREQFLQWRKALATLQEEYGCMLTPYEKNLEFWRQLWRVVEKSDVIVQIVDARNPLLFRCEDLEKYVKEVSENKMNIILINKADFLTEIQRQHWADYFTSVSMKVVFFSAILEEETKTELNEEKEACDVQLEEKNTSLEELKSNIEDLNAAVGDTAEKLEKITLKINESAYSDTNSKEILSRKQLTNLFRHIHKGSKVTQGISTIGLVGYPNVGKSSTINALFAAKKVSVSATPGKTKHFQTLYLENDILLCDCPGLVMPTFVFTKAEMITNGILPIDQMRDHVPPVNLVTSLIPRHVIEDKYGIMLPLPLEGEDPDRNPTAEELLNVYGYNRGFMTSNGQPDNPRSSRYVLKDFMSGKILYCHAPPNLDQIKYHSWPERIKAVSTNKELPPRAARIVRSNRVTTEDLDSAFFKSNSQAIHSKGVLGKAGGIPGNLRGEGPEVLGEKPWKKINKHANKNKREKLRRVYAHLDQH